ncbi:histidinol dehydrogenase [Litorivicinus lipolyticus]|uniref:Histidinol dehydrogenase n=1 Tax=Litorivicinus lipolyticus TaxID=418701 RepID=A0A5Q2QGL0_9GAMM|nr:histidinol dehydrogenase [Litorivicinus lipolyticus]
MSVKPWRDVIRHLQWSDADAPTALALMTQWEAVADLQLNDTVNGVLAAVRSEGDVALVRFTEQFDRHRNALEIPAGEWAAARARIAPELEAALVAAGERVREYHQHQSAADWSYTDALGNSLGQRIRPLDRVGVYVPGGKAAYPSSVLMNVMPAKVAGVSEIIMVVPTPDGVVNDAVLAAADIAGVDRVFGIGGAQAVAALAFGTESVPAVDKIVGPGNAYVAAAKRAVFGRVGIDMIAGPSEILVVCDDSSNPEWVAMDLFSQAEHDEMAQSILVSLSPRMTTAVLDAMSRLLPSLERREIVEVSLRERAVIVDVASTEQACELINQVAPEHLELCVDDSTALMAGIRHAGAIFLGHRAPESLGDYCAGPNHVLPTSGTARFASPLGVYDFVKRSSVMQISAEGSQVLGQIASVLGRAEGLTAHARAAEMRLAHD